MSGPRLRAPLPRRALHVLRRGAHGLVPGERELPRWLVVGAKRAGTTSLVAYLLQHPGTLPALVEKGSRYFDVNHDRGWTWFTTHFPARRVVDVHERRRGVRPQLGESSPYYCYHPQAPARIAAELPGARLVLLLREPVERAWSHHRYEVARGFEHLGFLEAVAAEPERLAAPDPTTRGFAHRHHSYLDRSRYDAQVAALRTHVGPERLLVLESEALFREPAATMARVHAHLGLAPFVGDYGQVHKGNPGDAVPADVRAEVAPQLAGSVARLATQLADPPAWLSRWDTPAGRHD